MTVSVVVPVICSVFSPGISTSDGSVVFPAGIEYVALPKVIWQAAEDVNLGTVGMEPLTSVTVPVVVIVCVITVRSFFSLKGSAAAVTLISWNTLPNNFIWVFT